MQTQNLDQEKIAKMDDSKLLALCQYFGEQARIWRQRFAGLLPEVNKRRLYKRKGFDSIFVFAKKLAGMSEEQVRRALNLDKKFSDKPVLQNLLVNGEVSINKLARIASIATPKNQEILAEQSKILSNRALETFVRDEKFAKENLNQNSSGALESENQNGSQKPLFEPKSVHVHTQKTDLFENVKLLEKFSPELKNKLKELDEKGLNINEILLELLQRRDQEIAAEKEKIAQAVLAEQEDKQKELQAENELRAIIGFPLKKPSRYLTVKVKNLLKKEHGDKCSIPGCNKSTQNIHHSQRFVLSQNNDPHYLAPLCLQHHEIAHSIDQKYQQKRTTAISAK